MTLKLDAVIDFRQAPRGPVTGVSQHDGACCETSTGRMVYLIVGDTTWSMAGTGSFATGDCCANVCSGLKFILAKRIGGLQRPRRADPRDRRTRAAPESGDEARPLEPREQVRSAPRAGPSRFAWTVHHPAGARGGGRLRRGRGEAQAAGPVPDSSSGPHTVVGDGAGSSATASSPASSCRGSSSRAWSGWRTASSVEAR